MKCKDCVHLIKRVIKSKLHGKEHEDTQLKCVVDNWPILPVVHEITECNKYEKEKESK